MAMVSMSVSSGEKETGESGGDLWAVGGEASFTTARQRLVASSQLQRPWEEHPKPYLAWTEDQDLAEVWPSENRTPAFHCFWNSQG